MSVPKIGKYLSTEDKTVIEIVSANPANGQIVAKYTPNPNSYWSDTVGCSGSYMWVSNKGTSGGTPFAIRFTAGYRPDGRPFAIYDDWTGAYTEGDILVMYGSRTRVVGATDQEEGHAEAMTLGGMGFKFQG